MTDSPTYWIARHDNDEQRHRIPVYSTPPTWLDWPKRWVSREGRAVCVIEGEENARALLGIEEIPRPGRCIRVEIVDLERPVQFPLWLKRSYKSRREIWGNFHEDVVHHVPVRRLPWVQDVTDALRAAAEEPTT